MQPEECLAQLKTGDLALESETVYLVCHEFAPHPSHGAPTFYFRILDSAGHAEVGGINLRCGGTAHLRLYAGHVGYTIFPSHRGRRLAAEALRLLKPLAHRLGIDPLVVTCDPENVASRRSCERAGAKLIEIVNVPAGNPIHREGHPRKCVYHLSVGDFSTY
jgi:tagatose 1,6-diphosphate aldolase